MASKDRPTESNLELYSQLEKTPYAFSFYQALRRIENKNSQKARIGYARKPSDDAIRIGQEPFLNFAQSSLSGFDKSSKPAPYLAVLFFGLFGPNGPLPLHLTEFARERIRNDGDDSLVKFVDVFHHRFLSFFYRIWSDASPAANLDRRDEDKYTRQVNQLVGLHQGAEMATDALPNSSKLHFSGRLISQTRNIEGLLAFLSGLFTVSIKVKEFVGQWLTIEASDWLKIYSFGGSHQLGMTTTLGGRAWECSCKFRLAIGPLTLEDYQSLLPGGVSQQRLISAVKTYIGEEYDWDTNLMLKGSEAKQPQLGIFGQLGWTTWLVDGPVDQVLTDLIINPTAELL